MENGRKAKTLRRQVGDGKRAQIDKSKRVSFIQASKKMTGID
jgi:hypothetical protein